MHSNLFHTRSLARSCFSVLAAAALVVLFVACGSTSGSSSSTASTSQNTPSTSSSGGRYGNGGGTTPTAGSASNLLKTATATVSGKSETILTNAQGMTLYYRTSDAPPATVCSGACASAWPPLIVSSSTAPTSATSLPGKLMSATDANGNQVEYNGHPLYTFSGDTSAGQTTGNGTAGIWFVATPDLKSQGTPQATPTTNGYSGY